MTDGDPYASFLEAYTKEAAPKEEAAPDAPRPGEHRNIWVWIEHVDREVYPASLEILGKGRELADQLGARCAALLFGDQVRGAAERLGEHGADRVFLADGPALREFRLEVYRDLLVGLVKEHRPEALIFPATVMGRNFAAQVAAALRTALVPNCIQLEVDASERRLRAFQTSFEDRLLTEVVIPEDRPQIVTITPGSFRRPPLDQGRVPAITDVPVPATLPRPRVRVGKREAPMERSLERADVVVVGGLGLASRDGFRLTEELSLVLGGHVGATRAAVACGWCDPRLLITSSKHELRPRLYIACGVIGEYDHLKALEDSRQIVAITPDPTAPVAEQADLVGIGDPPAILNAMLEALRAARKARFLVG